MSDVERSGAELPEYAELVLEVAERIPPGRVMTYGDVAEWLGAVSYKPLDVYKRQGGGWSAPTACCCPVTSCVR